MGSLPVEQGGDARCEHWVFSGPRRRSGEFKALLPRMSRLPDRNYWTSTARDRGMDTFVKGAHNEVCPKWEITDYTKKEGE